MPIAVVCACAIGAAPGYFFGQSEGAKRERAAVQEELNAAAEAREEQAARATELERRLSERGHILQLLEVRNLVHQSMVELHERNFGLAVDSAHRAGELLARLEPEDERYAELAEQLRVMDLEVTPDIHDQAMWLAGIAAALDTLLPIAPTSM